MFAPAASFAAKLLDLVNFRTHGENTRRWRTRRERRRDDLLRDAASQKDSGEFRAVLFPPWFGLIAAPKTWAQSRRGCDEGASGRIQACLRMAEHAEIGLRRTRRRSRFTISGAQPSKMGAMSEDEPVPFACECDDAECATAIELPLGEYERAVTPVDRFVVAAGHEDPAVEVVVERRETYLVVSKPDLKRRRG